MMYVPVTRQILLVLVRHFHNQIMFFPSSEQQPLSTADMEVTSPGVIGEHRTEMISSNIAHSLPQPQHQDKSALENLKAYEPDSMYEMSFITKSVDGETVKTRSYPSEDLLHKVHISG